jgi:hypothetical protein
MSMFDQYKPFEDHFNPGDTFTLEGVKLGAMLNTVHGDRQQVLFKIGGEVYSALGAGFLAQVQRATARDFPAEVEYILVRPKTQGRSPTKMLWPTSAPKPDGYVQPSEAQTADGFTGGTPATTPPASPASPPADDDIPF